MTYTYTYDDNGNILTISDGTDTTSYVYDSQNQLIRENNQEQGCTYAWEYSEAGNIHWEGIYDYSTEEEPEYLYSANTYTYDDEWGDVLVGVGSKTYTVDAIGNRTSRTNGSYTTNYTWEHGRQLASVTNGTQTWQYKYNNDGMLIEQRNGNNVYSYVYNGTQLSQMSYVGSWEEYTMHFTYDANGTPMTVTFDYVCYMDDRTYDAASGAFLDDVEIDYTISDTYYYITNIQGDVIELLNSDGESAGYYRYDAWGKDIDMWDLEEIIYYNPLRYRGYIYDRVSGYYYLQTRFYDADVGRFINADAYVSTGQGVLGNNMFAYCNNNPIMYIDPTGTFSLSWIIEEIIIGIQTIATCFQLSRMGFDNISLRSARECAIAMKKSGIDTATEKAHFFAQCYVEGNLSLLEAGWLDEDDAEVYRKGQPYYPYYGAGYIQLTWECNYKAFSEYVGDPKIYTIGPKYVAANYAWSAAGWFWTNNNINSVIANGGTVKDVTRIVNGGYNGLQERIDAYNRFIVILGG